jgi:toxin YoeB
MRLVFDDNAFDDLLWWVNTDVRKAKKVLALIREIKRTPFIGTGKPEPLRHELSGCWSRRIDEYHRLIYEVGKTEIRILACRFHYDE